MVPTWFFNSTHNTYLFFSLGVIVLIFLIYRYTGSSDEVSAEVMSEDSLDFSEDSVPVEGGEQFDFVEVQETSMEDAEFDLQHTDLESQMREGASDLEEAFQQDEGFDESQEQLGFSEEVENF